MELEPSIAAADANGDEAVSRIQVVVRVRPVLPHEASQHVAVSCAPDGGSVQVELPQRQSSKPALAASTRPDGRQWSFDACCPGATTQAELFDVCGAHDLVEAAVDGFSVTVFAFGQTGSGKTHTIVGPDLGMARAQHAAGEDHAGTAAPPFQAGLGDDDEGGGGGGSSLWAALAATSEAGNADAAGNSLGSSVATTPSRPQQHEEQQQPQPASLPKHAGLLARCTHHLFASIAARGNEASCSVLVEACEVYNDTITDLLSRNKSQQLQVRQDPRTDTFYAEGLTQAPAASPGRVLKLLSRALAWRHTRSHKLNSRSSRSHAIITLTVLSHELGSSSNAGMHQQQRQQGGVRRCGKICLVDLAGSERLDATGNTGAPALRETGAINRSLFVLTQVLAALSVGGPGAHVPYRDSKLTQLLWDGLRGGGRVLMLACLCPMLAAADENMHTLQFASLALRITSVPVIRLDPADAAVNEMRGLIRGLQEDCRRLAGALTQMATGAELASVIESLPPNLLQDALRYGSSSAPAANQQRRMPTGRLVTSGGLPVRAGSRGVAASANGGRRPQALSKPGTADGQPRVRHSMPALLAYTRNACPSRSQGQRGPVLLGQYDMRAVGLMGSSAGAGGASPYGGASNAAGTTHQPRVAACGWQGTGGGGGAGRIVSGGGSNSSAGSLGPTLGAQLYPGSLRQDLYRIGASGLKGVLSQPDGKPGWSGSTRPVCDWPATLPAASGGGGAGTASDPWQSASASATTGPTSRGLGSISLWGPGVSPPLNTRYQAAKQAAPAPLQQLLGFPELAALERQFQQHCLEPGLPAVAPLPPPPPAFDVQLLGSSSVVLPSSLPASINEPRTLVPVRLGLGEGDAIGTSPAASPVKLALAAASSKTRPIAVSLPVQLTAAVATACAAQAAAAPADEDAAAAAAAVAVADGDGDAINSGATAEPAALSWAARNQWFGADAAMTRLAYEVHDVLVGKQQVDPSSQLYYTAIESRVAAAFPERWQHWQQQQQQPAIRVPGGGVQMQQAGQHYASHHTPLKSPVPRLSGCRSSSPEAHVQWAPPLDPAQQPAAASGGSVRTGQRGGEMTISQLLQHPQLATPHAHQQQHHQETLPDRSLRQRLVQQLQSGELLAQHHHNQQQQQHALLPAAGTAQRESSNSLALPVLRPSESPVPPVGATAGPEQPHPRRSASASPTTAAGPEGLSQQQQQQQQQQRVSVALLPPPPPQAGWPRAAPAAGVGLAALTSSQDGPMQGRYGQQRQQQRRQQHCARDLLERSMPSLFDGAGPLTAGMRPAWHGAAPTAHGVQAGADMAHVLRAGLLHNGKSLTDLQAEYKAARALVLDRLRQQKEAAEVQRKSILLQLGRAISDSQWRA